MAAQGRSLLLTQGWREKKVWWAEQRWAKLQRKLPAWLVARLEIFRELHSVNAASTGKNRNRGHYHKGNAS
jgi:hypothetical protein